MKIYAPDYYNNFSCISKDCKHNCCIGWEIDIDEKTLEIYKNTNTDFGKRIMGNIEKSDDCSHFILSNDERCPFLNEDNLCDIILNLGEASLCQICSDHPRFRNFFNFRTEVGLGLCCEEAGRIILTNKEKVSFIEIANDEKEECFSEDEEIFFDFRNSLINIIQDRSIAIDKRIFNILTKYKISFPYNTPKLWAKFFSSLEQLDLNWGKMLLKLEKEQGALLSNPDFEIEAEQLLVYFIYRHLADGLYDGNLKERIAFSILSVMMIDFVLSSQFKSRGYIKTEDIIEISRIYSSEIEYSEENINTILSILKSSA